MNSLADAESIQAADAGDRPTRVRELVRQQPSLPMGRQVLSQSERPVREDAEPRHLAHDRS